MQKFFFENQATKFWPRLMNIFLGFAFLVIWVAIASRTYDGVYGQAYSFKTDLFGACMITPLWEELRFRWVPIAIGKRLGQGFIIPLVILSSIQFGLAHGEPMIFHLMVQGVMGFVLSWVYIKNRYSYLSSVFLHAIWNAFIIFTLPHLAGLF
jgi:hypothetical protein